MRYKSESKLIQCRPRSPKASLSVLKLAGGSALLLLVSLVAFASAAQARDPEANSVWAPGAITLDGQRTDWPENSISSLPDVKGASFGVCNDSQNVYVMLCFQNDQWARVIKMGGLTVWLDPQGKKKKQFMLKLVGGPSWEEIMKASGRTPRQNQRTPGDSGQESGRERMRRADTVFTCMQKDYLEEKAIPINGKEGPAAAFAIDKGFFVYEFSVPLRESSVLYYGLGTQPGQAISVGLVWGDIDRSSMRGQGNESGFQMGDRPGRGGFGGGGGFPGGMGRGGGHREGGEGGEGQRQMPQKEEVWLRARLASTDAPSKTETK